MEFPKEIKIKRVARPGVFGIASFANTFTSMGCPITENGYKSGLTGEEQSYFEKKLKLAEGTLDAHSEWWGDIFNVNHAIVLHNTKTTKLILDNPINQIKYKVLLAANKVANSEFEVKPYSEFYIDNTELKAKYEVDKFNYEMEGMESIITMTLDQKVNALRLFGKTGLNEMTEMMAKAELGRLLKADPKKFVETINDKNLILKAFIFELIETNIITRSGQDYKYGDDYLGSSIESCVAYFENIKNQELKLNLMGKLSKSKKPKKV